MARMYCPECDSAIVLGKDARVGIRLVCYECDVELEIISLDPPEADWVYDWSWEEEGALAGP